MAEALEAKVDSPQQSLGRELVDSLRNYPSNWVNYMKQLGASVLISSVGSATAQWIAQRMGYNGATAQTVAGYIGGYGTAYPYFFGSEFLRNRDKYPRLFSREFGKFVGTFLAADYVADLSTFSPAFIASNVWLTNHTDMHPLPKGLIAWNTAGLLYTSVMAGLHPAIQRVNNAINRGIKSVYHKIKRRKKSV